MDKSVVLQANAGDLSKLSNNELEAELRRQFDMAQTIDVTPQKGAHDTDNDDD